MTVRHDERGIPLWKLPVKIVRNYYNIIITVNRHYLLYNSLTIGVVCESANCWTQIVGYIFWSIKAFNKTCCRLKKIFSFCKFSSKKYLNPSRFKYRKRTWLPDERKWRGSVGRGIYTRKTLPASLHRNIRWKWTNSFLYDRRSPLSTTITMSPNKESALNYKRFTDILIVSFN